RSRRAADSDRRGPDRPHAHRRRTRRARPRQSERTTQRRRSDDLQVARHGGRGCRGGGAGRRSRKSSRPWSSVGQLTTDTLQLTKSTRRAVTILMAMAVLAPSRGMVSAGAQAPAVATTPSNASDLIHRAFTAAYNLDLDDAKTLARQAVAAAPNASETHRT